LCEGCIAFDKSAHLFVDLPATKAIFSGIQADLSFTPQINFADSSNSQSIMPGCIRAKNIQGPDKGDRHLFPINDVGLSKSPDA
jgi:hypothetical protein